MQCELVKHRLFNVTVVEFWAGQEAENEFAVPGKISKHWFLDLLAFRDVKVQKIYQSAIGAFETSLYRFHPSFIWGWSKGRKLVSSA